MAASSRLLRVIEITNNLPVFMNYDSKTLELLLKSVSVTSDNGTTVLTITEASGHYAFGNKKLTGVAQPAAEGDAVALNASGQVASGFLPSYVDDVIEAANFAALPTIGAYGTYTGTPTGCTTSVTITANTKGTAGNVTLTGDGTKTITILISDWNSAHPTNLLTLGTGDGSQVPDNLATIILAGGVNVLAETGKIYVTLDDNLTYRYSGTAYVEISKSLALGTTSSTAYRGDYGNTAYTHAGLTSGNPHAVSKSNVNLGSVDNVQQLPMSYLDTDGTLAANSDTKVPSQAAVVTYVGAQTGNSAPFTNKEGGSVAHTIRQLVFLDTAAGGMKKAIATSAALAPSVMLAMVKDTTIADDASGNYYLPRKGVVVGGFTGLTVGPYYLSRATAGAMAVDLTNFTTGDHIIFVGWAISTTQLLWLGEYQDKIG